MQKYKLRTPTWRAISVPAVLAGISTCPTWGQNRHADGKIVLQLGSTVAVVTPKGRVIATATDTITQDALKNLAVIPTDTFSALYELE